MNRNSIIAALLMIFGVAVLGFFTPWWVPPFWIVFVSFIMKLDIKNALLLCALCYGLVWTGMARYMSEQDASDIISKTGVLLGGLSHQMIFVVIAIISFITGGLAGWFGNRLGAFIRTKNTQA